MIRRLVVFWRLREECLRKAHGHLPISAIANLDICLLELALHFLLLVVVYVCMGLVWYHRWSFMQCLVLLCIVIFTSCRGRLLRQIKMEVDRLLRR